MQKIRDIAFIIVAFLGFLLPMINATAGVFLEGYETKEVSALEGRSYQAMPKLGVSSFAEKSYQDDMEAFLADHVPKRDGIMLFNASVQRKLIEAANLPFGFPVYHSYLGSSRVIAPEWRAVVQTPDKANADALKRMHGLADKMAEVVARHPDKQWRIAIPNRTNISIASPAHGFVSSPADYDVWRTEFLERLPEQCVTIDLSNTDTQDYFEKYFRTDHHWNGRGAVEGYSKIIGSLGFAPVGLSLAEAYAGPFYGANARHSLFIGFSDNLVDASFDLPEYSVRVNGEKEAVSWLNDSYDDGYKAFKKSGKFGNVYSQYYHKDKALIDIDNASAANSETLLLVADSFSNSLEPLFASHYRHTYIVDPRHFERDGYGEWSIDSFIEDHDVSAVVILCGPDNLMKALG